MSNTKVSKALSFITESEIPLPNFSIELDLFQRQNEEQKLENMEEGRAESGESAPVFTDLNETIAEITEKSAETVAPTSVTPVTVASEPTPSKSEIPSIVVYSEEEVNNFVSDMVAKNTKRSTATAICRLESWYKERHGEDLDLNTIGKEQAPSLLKHFFLEIRQTGKENRGKEYEPGSLQTYRNGLRRYFFERPCPPAVDNFDIEKTPLHDYEDVAKILSSKKKDLKQKGLGNLPNAALPVEDEELEMMWSSGAISLHNPKALLQLVWWNNMTHLGMRAVQEQHDCQIQDFTITEQYIEYTERQTKNRQGDAGSARKRARKYNNKIWCTDGGERDPYRAFMEYLSHRPQGENVPPNFFLTPISEKKPSKGNIWYKSSPVGRNTLAKQMKIIATTAGIKGKYSNSSGRKTVIQTLREEFHPLEICELTGHVNPESISSYSHNPLEKQRKMSNHLAGFNDRPTSSNVLVERNDASLNTAENTASHEESTPFFTGALGGLFTNVTFNNSPINISINRQSSVNKQKD